MVLLANLYPKPQAFIQAGSLSVCFRRRLALVPTVVSAPRDSMLESLKNYQPQNAPKSISSSHSCHFVLLHDPQISPKPRTRGECVMVHTSWGMHGSPKPQACSGSRMEVQRRTLARRCKGRALCEKREAAVPQFRRCRCLRVRRSAPRSIQPSGVSLGKSVERTCKRGGRASYHAQNLSYHGCQG